MTLHNKVLADTARPIIPAPEHDPLPGAKRVAGQIERGLREAMQAHQELVEALLIGDLITINAALLKIRTGAQSAQVLAFSLHQDVTAKLRSRT